jgi:hypothetical protein
MFYDAVQLAGLARLPSAAQTTAPAHRQQVIGRRCGPRSMMAATSRSEWLSSVDLVIGDDLVLCLLQTKAVSPLLG